MFFKKKVKPVGDFEGFVRLDCLNESADRKAIKWRLLNISIHHVASSTPTSHLQSLPFIGRFF